MITYTIVIEEKNRVCSVMCTTKTENVTPSEALNAQVICGHLNNAYKQVQAEMNERGGEVGMCEASNEVLQSVKESVHRKGRM